MRKSTHWISLLITSAGIVWNAVWFGTLNPADPKDVISFISVMGTVLPGLYLIFSLISALNDALLRLRSTLEDVRKHDAAREMLDLLVNTSKVKGAKNDRNLHRRVLAELEDDNRRQLISNLPSVADFLERRGPALRVPEREPASEFVFRLADGLPMGSIWLATVKSSMGYGEIASPVFKRFNARILDRSRNGDICVGRLYYLPSSGTARHIIRRTPSTAREEELLCEISDSEARDILVKISGIDDVRAYNSDKKDFAMILDSQAVFGFERREGHFIKEPRDGSFRDMQNGFRLAWRIFWVSGALRRDVEYFAARRPESNRVYRGYGFRRIYCRALPL